MSQAVLYKFPNATWVENLAIRQTGQLILTTISSGTLWTFDTNASAPREAITLPNITAITGISEIAPDEFVVAGGVISPSGSSFVFSNTALFIIDFQGCKPTLKHTVPVSFTFPNGVAVLPSAPNIVLVSDSVLGGIWRVDTKLGSADKILQDPSFAPTNTSIGINGLKIWNEYLYYATTATGIIGRVAISKDGFQNGPLEVVAQLNNTSQSFDDFSIDKHGTIYAAVHPNAVECIFQDGRQVVLTGGGNSTLLEFPTSVAVAQHGLKEAFGVTAGFLPDGTFSGGQVFRVPVPKHY
ncbi:calcium-dependent phosphotriesterase [Thozetella sp. PMI_491]|nr:calcium-dependent phosphotriesterase [Thozetella sp. PMI_491]